jgi:putative flippase GtrA
MNLKKLFESGYGKFIKNNSFIKYALAGPLVFLIKFGLTVLFTDVFKWYYLVSYSLTLGIIIVFTFIYNLKFAFKAKKTKNSFLVYVLVYLMFLAFDFGLVTAFTELIKFDYRISIICSTFVIFFTKYLAYKHLVFKR